MENIETLKESTGTYDHPLHTFEGFFSEIEKMKSLITKTWTGLQIVSVKLEQWLTCSSSVFHPPAAECVPAWTRSSRCAWRARAAAWRSVLSASDCWAPPVPWSLGAHGQVLDCWSICWYSCGTERSCSQTFPLCSGNYWSWSEIPYSSSLSVYLHLFPSSLVFSWFAAVVLLCPIY